MNKEIKYRKIFVNDTTANKGNVYRLKDRHCDICISIYGNILRSCYFNRFDIQRFYCECHRRMGASVFRNVVNDSALMISFQLYHLLILT